VIRTYWVYILASRSRVLYTGVTNDLGRRVLEHKQSLMPGFTQKYRVTRLVYFEQFGYIGDAIAREKQIKGWVRARKVKLIEGSNAAWADLAQNWFSSFYPGSGRLSS
jgi:putative endonuclease